MPWSREGPRLDQQRPKGGRAAISHQSNLVAIRTEADTREAVGPFAPHRNLD